MFRKGLKKRLRLKALKKLLKPIGPGERCLLLTCGDNNGAMNYFLRELGGQWSWADLEDHSIAEMSALLGDPVVHASENADAVCRCRVRSDRRHRRSRARG
jgi:hypothetical protein